jgi:hypothetical protein
MELTGTLSDFGLSDILQILGLSKKTGTLSIRNATTEGQIVIEDGRITYACMRPGESFANFLQQEGVLTDGMLQKMLEMTTVHDRDWDFSALMVESGIVKQEQLDDYVHRHLLKVIGNLLHLEKGEFGIVLNEIGLPGLFDEVRFVSGLGVEEVLLKGAKEFDELSRQRLRLFQPPQPLEQNGHQANGDFDFGKRQTGNLDLNSIHLNGHEFGHHQTGSLDIAANGNGFSARGTGDLQRNSVVSSIAISNGFSHSVETATIDGLSVATKRELAKDVAPEFEDDESLHLLNGNDPAYEQKKNSNNSNILCSLLAELRSLTFEAEVSLSVMRYASEVASRGILFVVKDDELSGLGQFGVDRHSNGANVDDQVRAIHIPIKVQSVFTNVVKTGIPYVGPLTNGYWNLDVISRLGETDAELKAFVLPLFCLGNVMFVIYGDNYPGGKDFEGFEEFLVFVNQASVILENIVLERKLLGMQ